MHPELDGVELKKIPPSSPGLPSPRPAEADSAIAALFFALFFWFLSFFPPFSSFFAFFFSRDLFFGNEIFALLTFRTQGLASPEQTGPPQPPSTPAGRRERRAVSPGLVS